MVSLPSALGFEALKMSCGNCCGLNGELNWWIAALGNLCSSPFFSQYLLRVKVSQDCWIAFLLGAVVGYVVAIPLDLVDFTAITQAQVFVVLM